MCTVMNLYYAHRSVNRVVKPLEKPKDLVRLDLSYTYLN